MLISARPVPSVTPGSGTSSLPDSSAFRLTSSAASGALDVVDVSTASPPPSSPPQAADTKARALRAARASGRRGMFTSVSLRWSAPHNGAVLMAEVVTVSETVAATPARGAKIAALAGLLARLDPGEVEPVVAFLAGEPRQGRIGVGWATLVALAPEPAAEPSLTVAGVDQRLGEVLATTGPGSVGARSTLLGDLLARATAPEADFLR